MTEAGPRLVSVSYERDAREELDVQNAALKRFAGRLDEMFLYQSALFGLIVLVLIVIAIEFSRRITPFFQDAPDALTYHSQFWAAFLPMLLIVAISAYGYSRMLRRKRHSARLARMRAKGWRDIEVLDEGLVVITDGRTQTFDWRAVRNVSHTKGKILLDLDQSTIYIPERAFTDRATFLSDYKVIRQAWHERLMQEVAQKG